MNISYNWLKEYIQITESPDELSQILTDLGLEIGGVEKKESIKGGLEGLIIGEVMDCWQHPNADKLRCTKVDIGRDELLNIVCGAPNVQIGQKVVVAPIGTTLFSKDDSFTIKKTKLRGELSEGMICAEDEIGLGTSHDGIMVLPTGVKVGTLARDYFDVKEDYILEVDITPNRADALSHYGVARDLAVYYQFKGRKINANFPKLTPLKKKADLPIEVTIHDDQACSRYAGVTIKGVKVKPSPEWLQNKLNAIGLTPVNNVVDVTNYVLHELGQPLHAFDYAVTGNEINVRSDLGGQKFTTLDGEDRILKDGHLMICNSVEGMCIAGVFGGEKSGVQATTQNIFLESAYFDPVSVRKTSKDFGLKTDASYRFERGIDPKITTKALTRAANLIIEVAGGEIASELIDVVKAETHPFEVTFSFSRCDSLLGNVIPKETIKGILSSLEINIISETEDVLQLMVPPYRVDVQRECDVIEEILRVYGYNTIEIPRSLNSSVVNSKGLSAHKIVSEISNLLLGNGFNEILTNSLTKQEYYTGVHQTHEEQHVKLLNPLSQELNILRRNLLFGGLESVARNQNRKNADLKFFEWGKSYHKQEETYIEQKHLALFLTGLQQEATWCQNSNSVSYYTIKGYLTLLFERFGIQKIKTKALNNDFLVEGLGVYHKKTLIAEYGKVRSSFLKQTGVKQSVYFADIKWDEILKLLHFSKTHFKPLAKYHPVKRDLSLLIDESVQYADLERIAFESERNLLKEVFLFDIYQGDKLPKGKKSYALSFILQSEESTLKEDQIEHSMSKLQKAFTEKLGAELR